MKRRWPKIECNYFRGLTPATLQDPNFLPESDPKSSIVLVDDQLEQLSADPILAKWFNRLLLIRAHHEHHLILVLAPDLFYGKENTYKTLRKNAHGLVLIGKGVRGGALRLISMEIMPHAKTTAALSSIYEAASEDFGYLVINLKATNTLHMFSSGILNGENVTLYRYGIGGSLDRPSSDGAATNSAARN